MEFRYTHVEKLSLATVHAVQRLRYYILLCQTFFLAHINTFQFILTRRMIGENYNKWIGILQEFDLEFVSAKLKNSLIFVEIISNFLSWMKERFMRNLSLMSTFFSFQLQTHGMGTLFFTYKP